LLASFAATSFVQHEVILNGAFRSSVSLRSNLQNARLQWRNIPTDWFWSVAGAAVIEIVATLLMVKLLIPMSGLEQAVPKID
jgi:hypothetical protein